jgi:uncharacterized protein YlxW (UPF0749 family)
MGIGLVWTILTKYWKYIAIILAVVAVYFFVVGKINHMKQEAYNHGVQDERTRVIKLIRDENQRNRQFEQTLQTSLDKFGAKLDATQRDRIVREVVYRNKLIKLVDNDPSQQCKVNPEVTKLHNQIRAELK